MKQVLTVLIVGLLLCTGVIQLDKSLAITGMSVKGKANELYVDGSYKGYSDGSAEHPYKCIQNAIDNASDSDTIYVFSGIYYENIVIDKSIHLFGNIDDNADGTIIDGSNNVDVVNISADWVNINGFSIKNSGNSSTYPSYDSGVKILSNNNCITNNIIIHNNIGIFTRNSENNIISKNMFVMNIDYGLYLQSGSHYNIVNKNIFSNNEYGARVKGSRNNEFIDNAFLNNEKGLYFCCGASQNTIYHNIFINNSQWNAKDSYDNQWDNGVEGNYWDDYTGEDNNGNDIGDTPYDILGGNNQDFYPLMSPWISPSNTIYNDGFNEKKTCGFYLRSSEPSIIFDRMISIFPVFNRILNIN